VVDVDRPAINRDEGSTAAFSKSEARKLLDAPPEAPSQVFRTGPETAAKDRW
jgi:hypothetical protein